MLVFLYMKSGRLNLNYLLIFVLSLFLLPVKAQMFSINKIWHSKEYNICLSFDSTSNEFRINAFYEKGSKRIIYRKKGNKIKLIWKYNQRIFPFGWNKVVSWFVIENLTENTLTLTLLPSKNVILEDLFYDNKTIEFISTTNCKFKLNLDGKEHTGSF